MLDRYAGQVDDAMGVDAPSVSSPCCGLGTVDVRVCGRVDDRGELAPVDAVVAVGVGNVETSPVQNVASGSAAASARPSWPWAPSTSVPRGSTGATSARAGFERSFSESVALPSAMGQETASVSSARSTFVYRASGLQWSSTR